MTMTAEPTQTTGLPVDGEIIIAHAPHRLLAWRSSGEGETPELTVRRCGFVREDSPLCGPIHSWIERHRAVCVERTDRYDPVIDGRRAYLSVWEARV